MIGGMKTIAFFLCLSAILFCTAGCETKAQTGALAGGAGGAGLGAIIGHQSGHTGAGALIGGAVGAIGGYIVGNEMDKADKRENERAYQQANRANREARYDGQPCTKQDVIAWSRSGVRDDVVIDRIERSGARFRVTARDENELRDAGVSEDVVRAMKDTNR